MTNKKRIAIFGSDGYLGNSLIHNFDKEFYSIDKFDLFPKTTDTKFLDIKDKKEVIRILNNNFYDVVISLVGVLPGTFKKKYLYNENLSSVSYLEDVEDIPHFIFCSSTAIYKNVKFRNAVVEGPFEIYGKSKYDCENVIKQNANSYTIFRIGTIISKDRTGGIMNLLRMLQSKSLLWLPRGGDAVHPFVSVEDVVKAIKYSCDENVQGTFDLIANDRISLKKIAADLNPKLRIIKSNLIDRIITCFGSDNLPLFGISRWHFNALKYDLPKSNPEQIWDFTPFKSMSESIKLSLKFK